MDARCGSRLTQIALLGLGCFVIALAAGCGGGGHATVPTGGGGQPSQPPRPPWTLTIYESGGPAAVAQGSLAVTADGYALTLAAERPTTVTVGARNVSRSASADGLVSLPVSPSQRESFRESDLRQALDDIAHARPTTLRSADLKRTYVLQPPRDPAGTDAGSGGVGGARSPRD